MLWQFLAYGRACRKISLSESMTTLISTTDARTVVLHKARLYSFCAVFEDSRLVRALYVIEALMCAPMWT